LDTTGGTFAGLTLSGGTIVGGTVIAGNGGGALGFAAYSTDVLTNVSVIGGLLVDGGSVSLTGTTSLGGPSAVVNSGLLDVNGQAGLASDVTLGNGSLNFDNAPLASEPIAATGAGTKVVSGTTLDTNWTLTVGTSAAVPAVVVADGNHNGVADSAAVSWIGEANTYYDNSGPFTLSQTFTLSAGQAAAGVLGEWALDDPSAALILNGHTIDTSSYNSAGRLVMLDAANGLIAGANTITLSALNGNGYYDDGWFSTVAAQTIAAGSTVSGWGSIGSTYNGSGVVQNLGLILANAVMQNLTVDPSLLINSGTMAAGPGASLQVDYQQPASAWVNAAGGLIAGTDATVALGGPFTNAGAIAVSGGTLDLGYTTNSTFLADQPWSNTGTITATGATVVLGSSISLAAVGALQLNGGTLEESGTLALGGATLDVSSTGGTFADLAMSGGTLVGGSLIVGDNSGFGGFNTYALNALSGVTVLGNLALAGGDVTLMQGSTVQGAIAVANGAWVGLDATLAASATLTNQVVLNGGSLVLENAPSGTYTVAGSVLVAGAGSLTDLPGNLGSFYYSSEYGPDTIDNQGSIASTLPAGQLTVDASGLVNDGQMSAVGGSTLTVETHGLNDYNAAPGWANNGVITGTDATVQLGDGFTNAAGGTIAVSGGTLVIPVASRYSSYAQTSWTNLGTIVAQDAQVALDSYVTLGAFGSFSRTGGGISLGNQGTLNLAGGTIDVTQGLFDGLTLQGGTLENGTVLGGAGGLVLRSGALDNVTVEGPVIASGAGYGAVFNAATILGGLAVLGGGATIAAGTTILDATGSVPGTIEVGSGAFVGFASGGVTNPVDLAGGAIYDLNGVALSVAAGTRVDGSGALIGSRYFSSTPPAASALRQAFIGGGGSVYGLQNQGTILADVAGTRMSLESSSFDGNNDADDDNLQLTNTGTIGAIDGGQLDVFGSIIAPAGSIGIIDVASGGSIWLAGSVAASQTLVFADHSGQVTLADPQGFAAAISGFTSGDVIKVDTGSVAVGSLSYNATAGTLAVLDSSGSVLADLTVGAGYTGSFAFSATTETLGANIVHQIADITYVPPAPSGADTWNGTTGNWNTAADWNGGTVPAGGNAAITTAGSAFTVAVTDGESVGTLTLDAFGGTLAVASTGTLTVSGSVLAPAGTIDLAGTLLGGTLAVPPSGLMFQGGTLQNVTFARSLVVAAGNTVTTEGTTAVFTDSSLTAPGTITVSSAISVVNNSATYLAGVLDLGAANGPTIAASGAMAQQVVLAGGTLTANQPGGLAQLLVGAGGIILGSGVVADTGDYAPLAATGVHAPAVNLTNAGTLAATVPGQQLRVETSGMTNNGVLLAANGGTLTIDASVWTEEGTVVAGPGSTVQLYGGVSFNGGTVLALGGTVDIGSASGPAWANGGIINPDTIIADNGTIRLAGNETLSALGTFALSGASTLAYVGGTLDLGGATLTAASPYAGMVLQGGTLANGTIVAAGTNAFGLGTGGDGALAGVSVRGELAVTGGALLLAQGATSDTGYLVSNFGTLIVDPSNPSLGQNVTLAHGNLEFGAVYPGGAAPYSTGYNNGTIATAGGVTDSNWSVSQAGGSDHGAVVLSNADLPLVISGGQLFGTATANGPTSDWIAVADSASAAGSTAPLVFSETFTVAGNVDATMLAGYFYADGAASLVLNGQTVLPTQQSDSGSYFQTGGVPGGFIAGANILQIVMPALDAGSIAAIGSYAFGAVRLDAALVPVETIAAGTTVTGVGSIAGTYSNAVVDNFGSLLAATPGGTLFENLDLFVNDGQIAATNFGSMVLAANPGEVVTNEADGSVLATNGGQLALGGLFVNKGAVSASGGATLVLADQLGTLTNSGSITAAGGTVEVDGWITNTGAGTIVATGADVLLGGTVTAADIAANLSRTGGAIALQGLMLNAGGTVDLTQGYYAGLSLDGGTLAGGTLIAGQIISLAASSTLSGVTVLGGFTLTGALAGMVLTIDNGTTLETAGGSSPAPVTLANAALLLADSGVFANNVTLNDGILEIGGATTLAAGVSLQGGGAIAGPGFFVGGTLVNMGTIRADLPGQALTVDPLTMTNAGSMDAATG
ncbi:MAG: hypothetical protein ACP5NP_13450, partial [Acetobacteraceae bacterium]